MAVNVLNHSLVKHKITNIRKKETKTKDFYQNVSEIAGLMAYEITRDFPLKEIEIETPKNKSSNVAKQRVRRRVSKDVGYSNI